METPPSRSGGNFNSSDKEAKEGAGVATAVSLRLAYSAAVIPVTNIVTIVTHPEGDGRKEVRLQVFMSRFGSLWFNLGQDSSFTFTQPRSARRVLISLVPMLLWLACRV